MRIVIDLQGAQASSRNRGIGRYVLSFSKAFVKAAPEHDVFLLLSGLFPNTLDALRAEFEGLIPHENMIVWTAPGPVDYLSENNRSRRQAAELVREGCLASLKPDFVILASLFEGVSDDAVTSIGALTDEIDTAVILFDLIPLIRQKPYLDNPFLRENYHTKLKYLRRAELVLAISESSRLEAIDYLGIPSENTVNISTASDDGFYRRDYAPGALEAVSFKHGLTKPFVMYTGGIDYRKNVDGLIRAFAKLPPELRNEYQLAVVCSVHEDARRQLNALASELGVEESLVLTGYVSEDDLIALYHACTLFVFPSLHEGFGLPVLEALCCGAPVIASGTTSLPEVVGLPEALFDPTNDDSISEVMLRGITDDKFRKRLLDNAKKRPQLFSWEATALKCKAALEARHSEKIQSPTPKVGRRPKLAYISPLPGARTEIADYSAELLPELSRFYDITVVVNQEEPVVDPWILANVPVISSDEFGSIASIFDRVIYQFGNSTYHRHMLSLIKDHPGVVVLHDFFLGKAQARREVEGSESDIWTKELYDAHGYKAIAERYNKADTTASDQNYPASLSVLRDALGVIVHSEYSLSLARQWYSKRLSEDWVVIPLLKARAPRFDKGKSRKHLGYKDTDYLICSFGSLTPSELGHTLIEAALNSNLKERPDAFLLFVAEAGATSGEQIKQMIAESGYADRIRIVGWTDQAEFRHYLAAADCAVQLRTPSRGEVSRALLDCLNYGIPTIVNADGSIAGLSSETVMKISAESPIEDLSRALEVLSGDMDLCSRLSTAGRAASRAHSPRIYAENCFAAIERAYHNQSCTAQGLVNALATLDLSQLTPDEHSQLAVSLVRIEAQATQQKTLFVDISELAQRDSRTGIQRMTRSILKILLDSPPENYRVEPVYATPGSAGYFLARKFTSTFMEYADTGLNDEPVTFKAGDIFLGLDLQSHIVPMQEAHIRKMRELGVKVYFIVYDLLPIDFPECFAPGASQGHSRWLRSIANYDGLIGISEAVANRAHEWVAANHIPRRFPLKIGYFHCGADIENSKPTFGGVAENASALKTMQSHDTFLMVGTLEPRKGHAQIFAGFELLWQGGSDVCLVMVGKQGWMVETLVERIRNHPQLGKKLFWFDKASDELLEKIYSASACLIAASLDEGFGLPLIEAALHNLPILARDIPVFREVAGSYATYFSGSDAEDVASAVTAWQAQVAKFGRPLTLDMPVLTWRESVTNLLDIIIHDNWQISWVPDESMVFPVASSQFGNSVGTRTADHVSSNGQAGFLFHGPYITLSPGKYLVGIIGHSNGSRSGARVDVTAKKGVDILFEAPMPPDSDGTYLMQFEITSETEISDFEVRLWVGAELDVVVSAVELKTLSAY